MRRREFISLLSSSAVAWPLVARAQQPAMPVIGFLGTRSSANLVESFRQGLQETGYVDGQNVVIEFRWTQGQYHRMPGIAAELVRHQVAVIFASASPGVSAARAATATIPIVFVLGNDPVIGGFVASFNRPGGNVTGVYMMAAFLEAKRLELLHEHIPAAATIAYLVNPNYLEVENELNAVQSAARIIGLQIFVVNASNERDIDTAFATFAEQRIGAVLVANDPFLNGQPDRFVALASRYAIPVMYAQHEFAEAGGLMSYGTSIANAYRQAGTYVGRILKGEKPADLPIQQSVKVELVINLKTAKALGLTFPITLLGRADRVIE